MYISDLILLIIVIGFFARMLYKRKKAKSAEPVQSPASPAPLLGTEQTADGRASLPRGIHELAVLSYFYDATRPSDDRAEIGVQPLDVIIEQDVNDLLTDLTRKGYRPTLSYMSVMDRIFIFVAY